MGCCRCGDKAGTDDEVRADVGAVTRGDRTVAWAAIANWEPFPTHAIADLTVWAVLRGMHVVGEHVLAAL